MRKLTRAAGRRLVTAILLVATVMAANGESETGWGGYLASDARYFPQTGLYPGQVRGDASLVAEPEAYLSWDDGRQVATVSVYARWDATSGERTHWDVAEFSYVGAFGDWEVRAGILKVFWGVTESQHLVDVINQTDGLEGIDGEDKLGQPLLGVGKRTFAGSFDFYYLPYFRERRFPGGDARLRPPLEVEEDDGFRPDWRDWHPAAALRWSHTLGAWDLALSQFAGKARDPDFRLSADSGLLLTSYPNLLQTGVEAQFNRGNWLWKLEAAYRDRGGEEYTAATVGYEYTFPNLLDNLFDLGWLVEYSGDSRGDDAPAPFQNDLFTGVRFGFNDAGSSQMLAGAFVDLESGGAFWQAEASRRIGSRLTLEVEARGSARSRPRDVLHAYRRDSHIQGRLAWHW